MKFVVVLLAILTLAQASPTPTPKPLKNPTAPHHHYDRRHPHRGAKPTPTYDPFTGGPNVNKPQEH